MEENLKINDVLYEFDNLYEKMNELKNFIEYINEECFSKLSNKMKLHEFLDSYRDGQILINILLSLFYFELEESKEKINKYYKILKT